jgi:long-chain acyl-CoA synthetase
MAITRLFDFPFHQLEKYPIPDSLVTKYDGKWVKTSTKEYVEKGECRFAGFASDGNPKGR